MTIKAPDKYLIKYQRGTSVKYYKIAPIHVTNQVVTAYSYADDNTTAGIKTFKADKIVQIELIKD